MNILKTEIKCRICKGSAKHPTAHPSHNAPCGACGGSGFSTEPCDRPFRGGGHYHDRIPPGVKGVEVVESLGRDRDGKLIRIYWHMWIKPNPDYDARLKLDQQGLLYA